MTMPKHAHVVDYINYGFHVAAFAIITGLIVAVIRRIRRAR
ncbi:hypothetical protein ACU639_27115 [Streptomyces cynarae]